MKIKNILLAALVGIVGYSVAHETSSRLGRWKERGKGLVDNVKLGIGRTRRDVKAGFFGKKPGTGSTYGKYPYTGTQILPKSTFGNVKPKISGHSDERVKMFHSSSGGRDDASQVIRLRKRSSTTDLGIPPDIANLAVDKPIFIPQK